MIEENIRDVAFALSLPNLEIISLSPLSVSLLDGLSAWAKTWGETLQTQWQGED